MSNSNHGKTNFLPLLLLGGLTLVVTRMFGEKNNEIKNIQNKKKRVFISFAIEDKIYRDYLVNQSKKENSPFKFIDMSVKQKMEIS